MGDELSLKFGIENDAASAAVDEVNKKLEETAAEAAAATEALKGTSSAVVDGAPAAISALSAVDQAAGHLQEHLDKLANAQGPRGMIREAAQAQVALEEYTRQAKAAGVSTEEIGKKAAAAGQAIEAGATKAAQFSRAMAEIRAQGALAANQLEALRGSGGSLTGMFESMRRTGTDTEKMFGNIGLSAAIGVMAFDAAVAAGEKVSKMLVGLVDKLNELEEKQHGAADQSDLMTNALRAAEKGQIAYGNSTLETIANYKLFQAETSTATGKLEDFTKALKDVKPAADMRQVTADMAAFGEALHVAFNRGSTDAALFLAANKGVLAQLEADWKNAGQIAPDSIQKITKALKEAEAAQKLLSEEGARAAIESLAAITTARKAADDAAGVAAVHAQGRFEAEMRRLNQEQLTSEQYSAKKKALYAEESAAESVALAQQAVANAKAELEQAKLQQSLTLSNDAMKNVVAAAGTYTTAIAAGVPPSQALANASGALRLAIEETGAAIPKLSKALLDGLVGGGMKQAADQTKAATDQHNELAKAMKKVEDGAGPLGAALTGLNKVFDTFGINAKLTKDKLIELSEAMGGAGAAG